MKKIFLMMATCSCLILYFSCSLRSGIPYDPSREQFVKQLGMMYEKDIIDFFPPIVATDNIWWSYFSSSWDDSTESIFRCCAYFSTEVSATTLDSLEKVEYLRQMNYDESLFLITVPYMRHEESYLNPMKDSLQIPIAHMRYSHFSLGETTDTFVIGDRRYVEVSEIIPDDLVIYVLEACPGNFWKNREKAALEERPMLIDPWRHGYSKGLAISRELSRVCWWAMAW